MRFRVHQLPPLPEPLVGPTGWNRIALDPVIALAFWMNCRTDPCFQRLAARSSSESSAVVTALKEKPKSMSVRLAPATVSRA